MNIDSMKKRIEHVIGIPKIVTRDMILANLDIKEGMILTEGSYQDLPIFIPYYHSLVLEKLYDWEDEGDFYFDLSGEDYLEFPELAGFKTLIIFLSDLSDSEEVSIDFELF